MKKNDNFNRVLAKYRGKWVALSSDNRVISSGYNAKAVYKKAKEKGIEIPTLFKVPKAPIAFVG